MSAFILLSCVASAYGTTLRHDVVGSSQPFDNGIIKSEYPLMQQQIPAVVSYDDGSAAAESDFNGVSKDELNQYVESFFGAAAEAGDFSDIDSDNLSTFSALSAPVFSSSMAALDHSKDEQNQYVDSSFGAKKTIHKTAAAEAADSHFSFEAGGDFSGIDSDDFSTFSAFPAPEKSSSMAALDDFKFSLSEDSDEPQESFSMTTTSPSPASPTMKRKRDNSNRDLTLLPKKQKSTIEDEKRSELTSF